LANGAVGALGLTTTITAEPSLLILSTGTSILRCIKMDEQQIAAMQEELRRLKLENEVISLREKNKKLKKKLKKYKEAASGVQTETVHLSD
jgi:uncharacterized membrane protein (DUF106 family)